MLIVVVVLLLLLLLVVVIVVVVIVVVVAVVVVVVVAAFVNSIIAIYRYIKIYNITMLLSLINFDCRNDQAHLVTIVVPGFQFLTHLHPISRGIWDLGYQAPSSTRQGRKEIQVLDHRHGWKEHIVLGTKTHGLSDLCQIFGNLEVKDRNASFASHEVTSWCENAGKTPRRQPLVGAVRPQMADIVVDLPCNTAPGTAWNSMEHGPMWDDVGCQVTCSIVPQQCKDFAREPGAMDAMGEVDSSHDLI